MKRLIVLLMLLVFMAGCSGVIMNAKYSALLDTTVIVSDVIAGRAEADKMTKEEMTTALRAHAQAWQQFQAARDGKEVE